jgi:hypothetical protein
VPPLAEYEAYRQTLDSRCRRSYEPAIHRRLTILMRGGETLGSALKLLGRSAAGGIRKTRDKMPDHLK